MAEKSYGEFNSQFPWLDNSIGILLEITVNITANVTRHITGNIAVWRRNITENFNSHFTWLEGGLWCGSGKNFVATIRKHIFTHHCTLHIY